ncbi:hypothetical protein CWB33_16865 [Bacillus cereus]|nr:hypothetical protein [Bacillus cereus]
MYSEKFTGSRLNRPRLQEGDTLVITKLDRLARNIVEGTEIVKELFSKGGSVHYPRRDNKSIQHNCAKDCARIHSLLKLCANSRKIKPPVP